MTPPTITPCKDLIDTLDRILDKGIVIDQLVWLKLSGTQIEHLPPPRVRSVSIERISVQATGERPVEYEDWRDLFPYWRRDLWSK